MPEIIGHRTEPCPSDSTRGMEMRSFLESEVAADPGSGVVFVRLAGEPDSHTKAQIEAALYIFAVLTGPGDSL
ncbi:hypothetical protein PV963_19900 [Streptomyces coeruleorubidus]|uniref:hypothetical protein n=1 Tax=Streptomyces coeruleorubidus TaxID=116188 RepID=UPI00237F3600|nr:hypothetical protein [Streptomyces coeruleorubidus]WDV52474.1 hypothetical protein PV963_19900 [Streptomyces coeruleorubidus]